MARSPKSEIGSIIEKAMPGYRLAEEPARPRGLDADGDPGPPPADARGVDFVKLQELYLGASSVAARPRSVDAASTARNTSRIVTVEKQSLMDSPKVGRKAVVLDDDDGEIVGRQG